MSSIFHVNDKISFYENKIIDSETFEGREESRKSIAVRVSSEPFEERHILRDISGKNEGIIKYHGNYEKNNVNYIWMEYFKGTLKDVSFTEDDSKLGKDKKILLEISKAFNFLHTHLVGL